jgi:hypothetical protein
MRRGASYDRIIRSMASERLQQQEELLGEHGNDLSVIDPVELPADSITRPRSPQLNSSERP